MQKQARPTPFWFSVASGCTPAAGLALGLAVSASVAGCSTSSSAPPQGGGDSGSGADAGSESSVLPGNADASAEAQGNADAAGADSTALQTDAAGSANSEASTGSTPDASSEAGTEAGEGGAISADAGGGEAGADGSSDLSCGTAEVCDDFETYTGTDLTPWVINKTNGTLMIDTTHVFSGKQAVGIHINAGANNAAQMTRSGAPVFPATPNLFWGRMMVYMTELPPASVHYDNIQADGTGTGQYRIGGMGTVLLNYQPNDCYDHPNQPMPENEWSCWQWLFDGTSNTIEFYIGGVLQAKVVSTSMGCTEGPATTVWAAPIFNAVHLGWINYQATTAPVDIWIDAVALGPGQIACPATPATAH